MSEDQLMYTAGPVTTPSFGKRPDFASEEFVAQRVQASRARPARGTGRVLESGGRPPEYAELSLY
jgi:hypothetical protein